MKWGRYSVKLLSTPTCPRRTQHSVLMCPGHSVQLSYFTLALLILGKRNPIKIKLEGRSEGEGKSVIQDSRNTSLLPKSRNAFRPHNCKETRKIISIPLSLSVSDLLFSSFLLFHIYSFLSFLCKQVLCLLFSIQSPKMCSLHCNACLDPWVYRTSQAQLLDSPVTHVVPNSKIFGRNSDWPSCQAMLLGLTCWE